jgi:hypothetical protein
MAIAVLSVLVVFAPSRNGALDLIAFQFLPGRLFSCADVGGEGVFRANGEVDGMKQSSSIDVGDAKALRRLVDRMGSLLPWQRQKARAALVALGREAVDPLLALYSREERSRKGRGTVYTYLAGGTLAFAALSLIGLLMTGGAALSGWRCCCSSSPCHSAQSSPKRAVRRCSPTPWPSTTIRA